MVYSFLHDWTFESHQQSDCRLEALSHVKHAVIPAFGRISGRLNCLDVQRRGVFQLLRAEFDVSERQHDPECFEDSNDSRVVRRLLDLKEVCALKLGAPSFASDVSTKHQRVKFHY